MTASIRSHPCASGLALRPKRLFGFDGTADEDPRFSTGLLSLRGLGPSSATATALLSPAVLIKLQGVFVRFLSRLRSFALLALIAVSVSACGYNVIPTKQEAAKAAWAEVQNQYQRRADLVPNL